MSQDEQRMIVLEETIAHQAKAIEELSDQLTKQWKLLDQTRLKIDRLTERLLQVEDRSLEAPPIARPPHY